MESFTKKEAAVATIISYDPQPEVLVLKRKANPRDPWSGQLLLPRRTSWTTGDPSLLATCIRETFEECGIQLSTDLLVKQYPVRQAGNHLNQPIPVTTYLF